MPRIESSKVHFSYYRFGLSTFSHKFISMKIIALQMERQGSPSLRAKLFSISRRGKIHFPSFWNQPSLLQFQKGRNYFQGHWNQLVAVGQKNAPGVSAIGERPEALENQSQTFKIFSMVWCSSSSRFDAVGLCVSFVYSCILTLRSARSEDIV